MNPFVFFIYNPRNEFWWPSKADYALSAKSQIKKKSEKKEFFLTIPKNNDFDVKLVFVQFSCDFQSTKEPGATEKEDGRKERWPSPSGRATKKCLKHTAVNKRAQRNAGVERASLPLVARKARGEKQEKEVVHTKWRKHRYGPKSQSKTALWVEIPAN